MKMESVDVDPGDEDGQELLDDLSVQLHELGDRIQELLQCDSHKMMLTVPLETSHPNRSRFLAIVSAPAIKQNDEKSYKVAPRPPYQWEEDTHDVDVEAVISDDNPRLSPISRTSSARVKMARNSPNSDLDYCLLGVDSFYQNGNKVVSLGFVTKMLWGTEISLDGDGGFGLHVLSKHYIFKPVSIQCLWTAIQTLHAISARLRPRRHSILMTGQDWVSWYKERINSPQSFINEWNEMPDILSRRPPSPDELSVLTGEAVNIETKKTVIKSKLREIMKTVNLDDITSKSIRLKLEADLNQKLEEFKAFIDEEILLILGQMDPASKIFDFMYLGSEWNASNLEELNTNGITHILNITREIDNFFPAVFKYLNIREYDVEETDLLKYWDETFTFIQSCIDMGGKVLIHCKMGISRSASTVCAFAMKYFSWSLEKALQYAKERRSVVNPNQGFRHQLQVYEGILEASRQRQTFRKLHRSKSESSVKKEMIRLRGDGDHVKTVKGLLNLPSEPCLSNIEQEEGSNGKKRPMSWSPPESVADSLLDGVEKTVMNSSGAKSPIICHCYSQLATYFSSGDPTPISGHLMRQERDQGAVNPLYVLPRKKEAPTEVDDVEDISKELEDDQNPNSQGSCPAQSHINQCTCKFELELQVSESPVDIQSPLCSTDQRLLRHLGTIPIHLRQTQSWTMGYLGDHGRLSDDSSVINHDNQTFEIRLDTSGAEELSVKTLADMFEYRLGEVPAKPQAKVGNRLEEERVGSIARQLASGLETSGLQSEC